MNRSLIVRKFSPYNIRVQVVLNNTYVFTKMNVGGTSGRWRSEKRAPRRASPRREYGCIARPPSRLFTHRITHNKKVQGGDVKSCRDKGAVNGNEPVVHEPHRRLRKKSFPFLVIVSTATTGAQRGAHVVCSRMNFGRLPRRPEERHCRREAEERTACHVCS